MMSAACSTDRLSTAVEFIRRSWSPGCSFPSAVLPAGEQHSVGHDKATPADVLPPGTLTANSAWHPLASVATPGRQNKKGPKDPEP